MRRNLRWVNESSSNLIGCAKNPPEIRLPRDNYPHRQQVSLLLVNRPFLCYSVYPLSYC